MDEKNSATLKAMNDSAMLRSFFIPKLSASKVAKEIAKRAWKKNYMIKKKSA